MKVAALDLGSNTFLCLIAEVTTAGIVEVYSDEVEVVRLGQGMSSSKEFHPAALKRADECLKKFKATIDKHKPDKILAMATSAARDAKNQSELYKIADKYEIPIEIIPGENEAHVTYQGAVSGLKDINKNLIVIDIGGGSTEIIFGQGLKLIKGESYNIGCVRLTEKFISEQPTSDAEVQNATDYIAKDLQRALQNKPEKFKIDEILAVAGTPTSLVAAELGYYNSEEIDRHVLTIEKLEEWTQKLQKATRAEKLKMGIPNGREDVILIGTIILLQILKMTGLKHIMVSTRGLRYGVALEMAHRFLPT